MSAESSAYARKVGELVSSEYRCPACGAASFTVACGRPCPHCTDAPSVLEIHGAKPECLCVYDCRDCSASGHEWHVHAGEECELHPGAPVS